MSQINRRRFLAATAAASAALAGTAQAQGTDAPGIALVKSLYAAFGKGDIATIVAATTADVDWESVGRPSDFPSYGVRKGQAGVQEFFAIVGGSLTFSEFSPKQFHAAGNTVFALGHYVYTVKKTGKIAESDWIHVFTIADGKVKAFREFSDTARGAEAYRG
jgi:ketosteroid isomerase-like protein